MPKTSFKELLDAGVHFGHLKRKWNPAMAPYIFMEKNGIHIIDLNKTEIKLNEAAAAMKQIAKSGRKILFVATKKQAKDIVAEKVKAINMPYVTERWPGGMLTNFPTIRKAVKKMSAIDKMATDGTFETLSKRERLQIARQRAKLEKNLGSIADLTRLPAAMFIVDVHKEYISVREANRLNIPVFAMVDTNSDPRDIDFPIPSNDDASKSISLIIDFVTEAIAEGLNERKMEKEKEVSESKTKSEKSRGKAEAGEDKGGTKTEHKEPRTERTRRKAEKVEVKEETVEAATAEETVVEKPVAREQTEVEAKVESKEEAKVATDEPEATAEDEKPAEKAE
ncbi:MAG: 30S ribosomal protein S2 [Bacteroidales bacterium]|nr:30S ribosomal protein S2 [Bacteroidales bacterium]